MSVEILLTCTGCTSDSYLRGVFYPGGSSYFGYTKSNDDSWINAPGGECLKYFKVSASDLHEGTWSGILSVKPDADSPFYTTPGEYLFKVGRYTSSCGATVWSTEKAISITGPSPTPTNIITPTSTVTPTNSYTPTHTPSITPSLTPKPTLELTVTPTITMYSVMEASMGSVAGMSTTDESDLFNVSKPADDESSQSGIIQRPYVFASAFVSLGVALLFGVLVWDRYIHIQKNHDRN